MKPASKFLARLSAKFGTPTAAPAPAEASAPAPAPATAAADAAPSTPVAASVASEPTPAAGAAEARDPEREEARARADAIRAAGGSLKEVIFAAAGLPPPREEVAPPLTEAQIAAQNPDLHSDDPWKAGNARDALMRAQSRETGEPVYGETSRLVGVIAAKALGIDPGSYAAQGAKTAATKDSATRQPAPSPAPLPSAPRSANPTVRHAAQRAPTTMPGQFGAALAAAGWRLDHTNPAGTMLVNGARKVNLDALRTGFRDWLAQKGNFPSPQAYLSLSANLIEDACAELPRAALLP